MGGRQRLVVPSSSASQPPPPRAPRQPRARPRARPYLSSCPCNCTGGVTWSHLSSSSVVAALLRARSASYLRARSTMTTVPHSPLPPPPKTIGFLRSPAKIVPSGTRVVVASPGQECLQNILRARKKSASLKLAQASQQQA
eukprot:763479-Hanusia_phi.AAC.3